MSIDLRQSTPRRGIGLTPMIDVVFLLLVFFMLTAQFDRRVTLDLAVGGAGSAESISRVVDIGPDALRLNGVSVDLVVLGRQLSELDPEVPIVLRAQEGADVQRLVNVIEALKRAGVENLVLVE